MYYRDLTSYEYIVELAEPSALNIGWLDHKHAFPKEYLSEGFLNLLFEFCLEPVNVTRGYHQCPFCKNPPFGLRVSRDGKEMILGSAEIRVRGMNGITYAAPNLIYHYVEGHIYKPPQEFIDAVLQRARLK